MSKILVVDDEKNINILIQSFFTLILNFFTLFFMLILIGAKIDPIKVTFIGSIFISFFSLFFINRFNKKHSHLYYLLS